MTRTAESLTDEQCQALNPEVRLIEAGPGAGKTFTVLARYRQQAVAGRGVALLSFTNRAVDVARTRCRNTPDLLAPPHFIGTFDQFLHRFVVTPAVLRRFGRKPQYVTSWHDLSYSLRRVRPQDKGEGLPLTLFVPDAQGGLKMDFYRLDGQDLQLWKHLSPSRQQWFCVHARDRLSRLKEEHVYDCDLARQLALSILRQPGSVYLKRLAARYGEIIVDEFQDCNETEHDVLETLQKAGTHVVGVADPDQAIYDFRRPDVDESVDPYVRFRAALPAHRVAALTTCHRSTPVICDLVSSLRAVGQDRITARAEPPDGPDIVHVVVGSDAKAGPVAMRIVGDAGVVPEDTWILAPTRGKARQLSQAPSNSAIGGTTAMAALLSAMTQFRAQRSGQVRAAAIVQVENFMLRMLNWPAGYSLSTRRDQLDHLGITAEHLRVAAARLVTASALWTDTTSCKRSVREIMTNFVAGLPVELVSSWGTRAQLRKDVWASWAAKAPAVGNDAVARANVSHIHGVKGEEFEAVVLALTARRKGGDTALQDWEDGLNSEQRRVLYVGASRARRCLVLVAPTDKQGQVVRILSASSVAFRVHSA